MQIPSANKFDPRGSMKAVLNGIPLTWPTITMDTVLSYMIGKYIVTAGGTYRIFVAWVKIEGYKPIEYRRALGNWIG